MALFKTYAKQGKNIKTTTYWVNRGDYMKKTTLDWIALILLVIGGLNWLLIGVFQWNLVDAIFGAASVVSSIVYILVGVSALYTIYYLTKN